MKTTLYPDIYKTTYSKPNPRYVCDAQRQISGPLLITQQPFQHPQTPPLKEHQLLLPPPLLQQRLLRTFLQRLRPTNQHQRVPLAPNTMTLDQVRPHPAPQPLPPVRRLRQRIHQVTSIQVLRRKPIQILFTQDIFDEAIPIQHRAVRRILLILHDRAQDLVDGRDAATATDHVEPLHCAVLVVDAAHAAADVFEFPDGAFHVDAVAARDGVKRFGHAAACAVGGVGVDLDQHVDVAELAGLRDGCVGANDGFAGHGVAEPDHEVLACGQAEGLLVVGEFETENAGVPGYLFFGVQNSFVPDPGVEEDGAWFGAGVGWFAGGEESA